MHQLCQDSAKAPHFNFWISVNNMEKETITKLLCYVISIAVQLLILTTLQRFYYGELNYFANETNPMATSPQHRLVQFFVTLSKFVVNNLALPAHKFESLLNYA